MADDNKQWFQQPEPNNNRNKNRRKRPNPQNKNAAGRSVAHNNQGKPADRQRPTGKNPNPQQKKAENANSRPVNPNKRPAQVKHQPNGKRPDSRVPEKNKNVKAVKRPQETKPKKQIQPKPAPEKKQKKPAPTDSEKIMKKQDSNLKKQGLKNGLVSFLIVAFALVALGVVVYHLNNYIADKPNLMFVSRGSIEHTIGARALIVRDETVISSGTAGDLVTQAAEGSRVATGQKIAMVVPEDLSSVVENLRNTQSQISEVQQELIQQGNAVGASVIYSEINGNIEPMIDNIRRTAMEGNIGDLSSYVSSINVLMDQRENELAELSFDDERLRVLRSDEAGYEIQLERRASAIHASTPGIVSFRLDGQETVLNFDVLMNAPVETINEYISSSVGIITSDLYAESGDNVARIARNEEQYIAVMLDDSDATAASFEEGSYHDINIGSEGISIDNCEVVRREITDGGILVVFRTTRYVEDLLDLRTVDIEIVITQSTGLRVPIGSLVNPDYGRGVANIYINDDGFAESVTVFIVDYDREFVIIEPIAANEPPTTRTVIITNPSCINPGEKVTK